VSFCHLGAPKNHFSHYPEYMLCCPCLKESWQVVEHLVDEYPIYGFKL